MENFVLIILAICVGYFLNRLNIFPKEAPNILNKFVIYISLPAMIVLQIPKLTLSFDIMVPVIVAWVTIIITGVLIFFVSKADQAWYCLSSVNMGNTPSQAYQ